MTLAKQFDERVIMSTVAEPEFFFRKSLGKLSEKKEIEIKQIENFDYSEWKELHKCIYESIGNNARKYNGNLAEKILSIFLNQRIRNGPACNLTESKEYFINNFNNSISSNEPIKIIIPSFPFKLPNPLRNNSRIAGLAEIASVTQLSGISDSIQRVYEPGVEIIIASDGILYSDLFGVDKSCARNYRDELKEIIKHLKAPIKVYDIIEDLVSPFKSQWDDCYKKHLSNLHASWETIRKKPEVCELARNSKRNLNLDTLVGNNFVPVHGESTQEEFDYFHDLVYGENISKDERREVIDQNIEDFTVGYLALNYTLRELKVLEKYFSEHLRGTVHPKSGQLGIHLVNKKTQPVPWAGMGVIRCNGKAKNGFSRVRFWYDIAREPEKYVELRDKENQVLGYKEIK
ncbi:L-tyrosine/L-tryptophan isonitrile synthase family protein [Candidatus Woesearchaeota archaeon]|jgi:hypothetical protein|nr:L-tyrosine/L-tryptophan isonitrile synthase family protein [Candidatus Woesearchaeota archaeon]MBT4110813.1 L-tyrosine/L-tryptophan isonitrile synthase family protein [Candidatus Woesearchaeota archaeon]MBT4336675.1 L-tyrosine/L-tryptophan isonitrile synthase family protein [Candidatus Woesearchaeota archaeon]MBT4469576.1 L-tyrosine/L-tryptophan isonitrile synthase family protein [Candidatus Woesearchaeota archaeon]MBT6743938.1 L-tyrosine/L-tryptophan isonitrile synthase family protein [Cand